MFIDDSPDPVLVGDSLTYVVTVSNLGPATAPNVSLTDTLPPTVTLESVSPVGHIVLGNTVTFAKLGEMALGGSLALTIIVKGHSASTITNTASFGSGVTDLFNGNNSAHVTTTALNPIIASLTNVLVDADGQFQLTLTGQPGQTYAIEVSADLTSWARARTNTAARNGTFKFTDTSAPGSECRFYRAVWLP